MTNHATAVNPAIFKPITSREAYNLRSWDAYLWSKYADQYDGLDDDMEDNYADWLYRRDVDTLIQYARDFAFLSQSENIQHAYSVGLLDYEAMKTMMMRLGAKC